MHLQTPQILEIWTLGEYSGGYFFVQVLFPNYGFLALDLVGKVSYVFSPETIRNVF
jgi:hypothetical protein